MGQLISDKFTAWQAECEARARQKIENEFGGSPLIMIENEII